MVIKNIGISRNPTRARHFIRMTAETISITGVRNEGYPEGSIKFAEWDLLKSSLNEVTHGSKIHRQFRIC
jgi:hypothetical protein